MGVVEGYDIPRVSLIPEGYNSGNNSGNDSDYFLYLKEKSRLRSLGKKAKKTVDSGRSNTAATSSTTSSYEIMNLGVVCALRAGDKESFIERISKDVKITQQQVDNRGNSILHLAAAVGHLHIVEYIVSTYKDLLEAKNLMGETAFHVAARSGNLSVVEYLVKRTADPSLVSAIKSKNGDTALHAALKGKHAHVALYLLSVRLDVSFDVNNDQVSPLCLAVEAGYYEIVTKMLEPLSYKSAILKRSGKSLVPAAEGQENSRDPDLVKLRFEGKTCLSLGASLGFYEGVCYILTKFDKPASHLCYLTDDDAVKEGHLTIVKEFVKHCPDSVNLLNNKCQNILHVAAESGKSKVVKYILGLEKQKRMLNEPDVDGNTPLHLATKNWHPKIVSMLTWNGGVNLKTLNSLGLTALDIAEKRKSDDYILRRRLTWMALVSAGAPNGPKQIPLNISKGSKCEYTEEFKDRVNTLLVVATLVTTVTFAAGFTLPGGFISSSTDIGMAVLVKKTAFKVFLFCDSIAMLSSMVTIMALIWAQLSDALLISKAFRVALKLLATALVSMSVAFMAGVCLVVSTLPWLAYLILAMDLLFLLALMLLIVPYIFSHTRQGFLRHIFHFPYLLMLLVVTDDDDK